MAFGKIYDTTYWGNGVLDNTIGWGIIYRDLVIKFDDLMKMKQISKPHIMRVYKNKDYTEESAKKLYDNFKKGDKCYEQYFRDICNKKYKDNYDKWLNNHKMCKVIVENSTKDKELRLAPTELQKFIQNLNRRSQF